MSSTSIRFSPWYAIASLTCSSEGKPIVMTDVYGHTLKLPEKLSGLTEPRQNYVIQAKTLQLHRYPTGQSAMVWYGVGKFPVVLAELDALLPQGSLVRWLAHAQPEKKLDELRARFVRRFGALPNLCS